MKSLSIWNAIFVCLVICSASAYASAAECPLNLPAGVVIRVVPDEKLMAGISSGPTILNCRFRRSVLPQQASADCAGFQDPRHYCRIERGRPSSWKGTAETPAHLDSHVRFL